MTERKSKPVATTADQSGPLPYMTLMPNEELESIEDIRNRMCIELAPATAYEEILCRDIVTLDQEIHRNRVYRDSLIRNEFRRLAIEGLFDDQLGFVPGLSDTTEEADLVDALISGKDARKRARCLARLAKLNQSLEELLARAVQNVHANVQICDRQIQNLERRRRALMKEYRKLQQARLGGIAA